MTSRPDSWVGQRTAADQAGEGGARVVLGADAGHPDLAEAERLLAAVQDLLAHRGILPVYAATHLVGDARRHYAVSLETQPLAGTSAVVLTDTLAALLAGVSFDGAVVPLAGSAPSPRRWRVRAGDARWSEGARRARAELESRSGGRVVTFPGQHALPPVVPVDEVPRRCAVDRVVGMAGLDVAGAVLHTRGHVRPVFEDGLLVLRVRPLDLAGQVVPVEAPDPAFCLATV